MDVVVAATVTGCYHGQSSGLRLYENNNKCAFPPYNYHHYGHYSNLIERVQKASHWIWPDSDWLRLSLASVCMG